MATNPSCYKRDWLRRTVRYSGLIWAAIFLSCLTAIAQTDPGAGADKSFVPAPAPRKALVIVAGNYANIRTFPKLPSAKMDFDEVSKKLGNLGFKVIIQSFDDPVDTVWKKFDNFLNTLEEGDLAVIYFSGHGFQSDGLNYFAPVDTPEQLSNEETTTAVVPLWSVIGKISQKKVGLGFIILDACRVNKPIVQDPKGIPKSEGPGLAKEKTLTSGIVVAYAADYGGISWASKESNENSLYTKHLIEKIDSKGLDIIPILRNVYAAVLIDCERKNCKQEPTFQAGGASFYPDRSDATIKLDSKLWVKAYDEKDETTIKELLINWPVSEYAKSAKRWLAHNSSNVPPGRIFVLDNGYVKRLLDGYRVTTGENLAAPTISTPSDSSEGHPAIVAVDHMKVFDQSNATAKQVATLQKGETVWILDLDDQKYKVKQEKGTSLWSRLSFKIGRDGQSVVGYVKDAVRIDDVAYKNRYIIELKPANEADLDLDEAILVSALDGKDLPQPISLTNALASGSSGPLSKTVLSQSSILVEFHNYIEGCRSVERARKLSLLRALQIRDALIVSGAKAEKIIVNVPKIFLLGDKGQPGHDEITIFIMK